MNNGQSRRDMLLGGMATAAAGVQLAQAQTTPPALTPGPARPGAPAPATSRPNFLVIFGDDVGWANISAYNMGIMGYRTPNIDRIAKEGALFTDHYAENSCTAGRSAFITGQSPCAPAFPRWACPARPRGCGRRIRPSPAY